MMAPVGPRAERAIEDDCAACGGSGLCDRCVGSGKYLVSDQDTWVECPNCSTTGECPVCDGFGQPHGITLGSLQ